MYALRYRGQYPEPVAQELDALLSALRRWITTEHAEDGTHTVEVAETVSLIIPNNTISFAQLQNMPAASQLVGRGSLLGAGDPEPIDLDATLTMTGTTLGVTPFGGSWTPTDGSGAGLSFTNVTGHYVRVGDLVLAMCSVTYPSTADGADAVLGGLPLTSTASARRIAAGAVLTDAGTAVGYQVNTNATTVQLVSPTALTAIVNSTLSGKTVTCSVLYTTGA